MSRATAYVIALWLGALTFVAATTHHARPGVTSCAQLVHNRIADIARENGLTIVKESLWACRQNGDEAVARVRIWYKITPYPGLTVQDTRTLIFRFERTPWSQTGFTVTR